MPTVRIGLGAVTQDEPNLGNLRCYGRWYFAASTSVIMCILCLLGSCGCRPVEVPRPLHSSASLACASRMPSGARAASWLLLFSLLGGEPSPVRSTSTALALHCHCRVEHSLRLAGARASVLLFEAASEGDADKLRTLLDKDKYDVNWRGEYGMSSVHIASLNNQAECVRLLISAGAKVNQFDTEGWTPLMAAASFAEHKMVKILLDAGANPTRRIQKGNHKGMNARDLVKDILEQKGSMATKCLELLEGVPYAPCPALPRGLPNLALAICRWREDMVGQ